MKRHTQNLLILITSVLVGCNSNPLKENLKEYHETVFHIKNGIRVKETESRLVQEYDQQGEVSKILYYDDDANTLSRYTKRRSDLQRGIITHTSFDASGKKTGWSEANLHDEEIVWCKDYDLEGNLIGELQSKSDDQGRQIEAKYLKGDGSVLHTLVYTYNDKKNTKTRITYDADGQQEPGKIVSQYDERHNLVKVDWYGSSDIFTTYEYTYFDGKRQTCVRSSRGKVYEKTIYKYNGDITET